MHDGNHYEVNLKKQLASEPLSTIVYLSCIDVFASLCEEGSKLIAIVLWFWSKILHLFYLMNEKSLQLQNALGSTLTHPNETGSSFEESTFTSSEKDSTSSQ